MKYLASLLFSVLVSLQAFGALTYRYVTDAGAGSADGSTIGNAMSFATFTDYMVTGGSFTAAPGDVFRIIGTITSRTTTTDTWVNGGNSTSPVVIEGWKSGGTTAYAGRTSGNGALITTDFPNLTYTTGRLNITGTFIALVALNIESAINNVGVVTTADTVIRGCKVTNTGTGASAAAVILQSRSVIYNSDVFLTGASGGVTAIYAQDPGVVVKSCRVNCVSATPTGINVSSSSVIDGNLVYNCAGVGIAVLTTTSTAYVANNTVVGCGGNGIDFVTGITVLMRMFNNMVTDNGGYGVDFNSTAVACAVGSTRTRDNTSGAYFSTDWVTATSWGDVTTDTGGQSTDYTNAGSLDFSLIAASPATSAAVFPYASMGALQRDQTSSGGGGQKSYVVP